MAIYKESTIIGNVPYNLAPYLSHTRPKQGLCRSDWGESQQGSWIWAGGYKLYGAKPYIDKMHAGNCGLPTFYWTSVAT